MNKLENDLLNNCSLTLELNNAKTIINRFIHSCSHNLKNPLTSIEGLVDVARRCSTEEEISPCLDLIQSSVTQMKTIIKKLDQCTCSLQSELIMEEIRPQQLLDKILSESKEEIELKHLVVSMKIDQPHKWIGDKHAHYLVLKNLIDNAIHFSDSAKTPKKLNVNIDVKCDEVKVRVSDNGIGISDREKNKVYIPFHRGSAQSKGSGLGLFLVKRLIEKLKASISFQSEEQVGTSVYLSIPNY